MQNEGTIDDLRNDFANMYQNNINDSWSLLRGGLFADLENFLKTAIDIMNPTSDNYYAKPFFDLWGERLQWLFVPSQEKVTNLTNTVKSKFGFIDSIQSGISDIQNMLETNENLPVLKISVPTNDWYNGELTVLDLNWYTPYKPYGDLVISAFIYVFFIWRVYIHLASTINGVGGSVNDMSHNIININNQNNRKGGS